MKISLRAMALGTLSYIYTSDTTDTLFCCVLSIFFTVERAMATADSYARPWIICTEKTSRTGI